MAVLTGNIPVTITTSGDTVIATTPGTGRYYRIVALRLAAAASTELTVKSSAGVIIIPPTQETTTPGRPVIYVPSTEWMLDLPKDEGLVIHNSNPVTVTGTITLKVIP